MKDIPTPPRIANLKRNRKKKRLRLAILFALLFLSIIGSLSYFSFYPRININNIIITGNSIINTEDLNVYVVNKLSGKYIKLFSRSNFLIYPKKKIYDGLLLNFPRIENISIKRDGFNTINIIIKERLGSYLYCGDKLPEKKEDIGDNCFFINNDGYIFDKAPYFSGDVYFKYYTKIDGSGINPLGSFVFSTEKFHQLIKFIEGIENLGFKPIYFVELSNGTNELYLKTTSSITPKIIFNKDNDLSLILDNLSLSMKKKEFSGEINSKYDNLLYIDLRFKNKVLYKFK